PRRRGRTRSTSCTSPTSRLLLLLEERPALQVFRPGRMREPRGYHRQRQLLGLLRELGEHLLRTLDVHRCCSGGAVAGSAGTLLMTFGSRGSSTNPACRRKMAAMVRRCSASVKASMSDMVSPRIMAMTCSWV